MCVSWIMQSQPPPSLSTCLCDKSWPKTTSLQRPITPQEPSSPGWRHDMETPLHYWPFVRGIHQSLMDSPNKGLVMWMFSLLSSWTSCWANSQLDGYLRRHSITVIDAQWFLQSGTVHENPGMKTFLVSSSHHDEIFLCITGPMWGETILQAVTDHWIQCSVFLPKFRSRIPLPSNWFFIIIMAKPEAICYNNVAINDSLPSWKHHQGDCITKGQI